MLYPQYPMTVEWNPWFQAAAGLALRVFLPGIAWLWAVPLGDREGRGRFFRFLRAGAVAAFIGLVATLAVVTALGEAGVYRPGLEWLAIGAISAAGLVTGALRDRSLLARHALLAAPAAVLFAAGVALVMALPRQGEWIVGGWDPGTYVDQGVFASRHGTFRPPQDPLFSAIGARDWDVLVPRTLNFAEGLPVFPIDPGTRRFEFFFFRGMPAAAALADRCGGLRAATRVNMVLGLLALLAVAHAIWTWFDSRYARWFAFCLFAAHPLWLYHLHFPTSEMLQQVLWFGLFGVAALRAEGRAGGVLAALGCLALLVTHMATAIFVCLFLAALAWCDLYRRDRANVRRERAWQVCAVLAGIGVDLLTSPTTVGRLDFIMPRLLMLAGLFVVCAVALDRVGSREGPAGETRASALGAIAVGVAAAAALAVLAGAAFAPQRFHAVRAGLKMIAPYLTPGLVALGAAGIALLAARPGAVPRLARAALFVMAAATIASVVESAIAPLYPWATRRFVALSVPMLAVAGGYALGRLCEGPSRWMRPAGVVVFAAAVVGYMPWSWPAVTATEYDGLSAKLEETASRIGPRDAVLVDRFAYGIPLKFLYGRNIINGERMSDISSAGEVDRVVEAMRNLRTGGWTVRFLTVTPRGMGSFPFVPAGMRTDWRSEPFVLREIEHSGFRADFMIRNLPMRMALHTWDPMEGVVVPVATNSVQDIDIGAGVDAVCLVRGFHGRETLPFGRTVRWTTGEGVVAVRGWWDAGARVEVDYVDQHCPGGAAAGGVTLTWDTNALQAIECPTGDGGLKRVAAAIPVCRAGIHMLRMGAAAWSPRTAFGSQDGRELGVMVDRVRVVPAGQSD